MPERHHTATTQDANVAEVTVPVQDARAGWMAICTFLKSGDLAQLPAVETLSRIDMTSALSLTRSQVVDELGVDPADAAERLARIKSHVLPTVAQQRANELLQFRGG
jgi:hypothetical protein